MLERYKNNGLSEVRNKLNLLRKVAGMAKVSSTTTNLYTISDTFERYVPTSRIKLADVKVKRSVVNNNIRKEIRRLDAEKVTFLNKITTLKKRRLVYRNLMNNGQRRQATVFLEELPELKSEKKYVLDDSALQNLVDLFNLSRLNKAETAIKSNPIVDDDYTSPNLVIVPDKDGDFDMVTEDPVPVLIEPIKLINTVRGDWKVKNNLL